MQNNSDAKYLDLRETQIAIKSLKDYFQRELATTLNLTRVSAPLFVRPETGLNDNLSGNEKAVDFQIRKYGIDVEIVQSLAKWKRYALKKYGFHDYEGIYADMNAIRPDEEFDSIHSVYVDQWDWEKIIKRDDRNEEYLHCIVREIYSVFQKTDDFMVHLYPYVLRKKLPKEIYFITSEELLQKYPTLSPKDRERAIAKEKKAVFLQGIGGKLSNGEPHDLRSPDYDDWLLNGDILFWNPTTEDVIELSSMGIRVDDNRLKIQSKLADTEDRLELIYHQALINHELPFTIGGGIGQSRICMFFLEKKHIAEVQASVWSDDFEKEAGELHLNIL